MRIISGIHKGRTIMAPAGLPVRPTTDYAKEGLFNIIGNHFDFDGLTVLDLFAGIGSIGFEFASRGASEIVAVDMNYKCIDFIRKTSEKLEFPNIRTLRFNVFNFLSIADKKFDIVFADPPYDIHGLERLPELVMQRNILSPAGWFILEHPASFNFSGNAHIMQQRTYGKVNFSIFKNFDGNTII